MVCSVRNTFATMLFCDMYDQSATKTGLLKLVSDDTDWGDFISLASAAAFVVHTLPS